MSLEKPRISIIIPLYNRKDLLRDTIDSIKKQIFTAWECLIIDDGSTDGSLAFSQQMTQNDKRFQTISRPKERVKGANACRNYGYEMSKAPYILWFDSDDILKSDYLHVCMGYIDKYSEVELFTCSHQVFQTQPSVITVDSTRIQVLNAKDFILRKQFLQTGAAVWKRSFINLMEREDHLFDECLSQSQDYDFHARALLRNPVTVQIPKVLYYFRRGNASISNQFMDGNIKHLESFLRVKSKLSAAQSDHCSIVIGLLNHVLASFRASLYQTDSGLFYAHIDYLKEWNNQYDYVSKPRIRKIILLAKALRIIKVGAFYFKNFFFINADSGICAD